jgi:hypothetical protein
MDVIPPKVYALAIDLERSGSTPSGRVIAIGASVVDENFEQLDSLYAPCFMPKEVGFDLSVMQEFWLGDELKELDLYRKGEKPMRAPLPVSEVLRRIAADTPRTSTEGKPIRTQCDAEIDALDKLVYFVQKWENKAEQDKAILKRCSDNVVFDIGKVNNLLAQYRPDILAMPFKWTTGKYGTLFDVHQTQRGLLLAHDPQWVTKYWGLTKAIEATWEVPKKRFEHTHLPHEDAYTIAFDLQVLDAIALGRLKKREVDQEDPEVKG